VPPPFRDGSIMDCDRVGVFDWMKESGSITTGIGKDWNSNTDVGFQDCVGGSDIKGRRGGRISHLIQIFESPPRVYDLGIDLKPRLV
jgi:hypothetical protein